MSKRLTLLLIAGTVLHWLGYSPLSLLSPTISLLYAGAALAWEQLGLVLPGTPVVTPLDSPTSLKGAIRNVTSDYGQLVGLLQEFMHSPGVYPGLEEQFTLFLSQKASRSHPRLENLLDWLLSLYRFAFPFLVVSIATKLLSGGGGRKQHPQAAAADTASAAGDPSTGGDAGGGKSELRRSRHEVHAVSGGSPATPAPLNGATLATHATALQAQDSALARPAPTFRANEERDRRRRQRLPRLPELGTWSQG